jgi:hypothetical protein
MYRGQAESHTVCDCAGRPRYCRMCAAKAHSDRLKPQTIYSYSVDSMQGNGKSDGVKAWSTTSPGVKTACRSENLTRGVRLFRLDLSY